MILLLFTKTGRNRYPPAALPLGPATLVRSPRGRDCGRTPGHSPGRSGTLRFPLGCPLCLLNEIGIIEYFYVIRVAKSVLADRFIALFLAFEMTMKQLGEQRIAVTLHNYATKLRLRGIFFFELALKRHNNGNNWSICVT